MGSSESFVAVYSKSVNNVERAIGLFIERKNGIIKEKKIISLDSDFLNYRFRLFGWNKNINWDNKPDQFLITKQSKDYVTIYANRYITPEEELAQFLSKELKTKAICMTSYGSADYYYFGLFENGRIKRKIEVNSETVEHNIGERLDSEPEGLIVCEAFIDEILKKYGLGIYREVPENSKVTHIKASYPQNAISSSMSAIRDHCHMPLHGVFLILLFLVLFLVHPQWEMKVFTGFFIVVLIIFRKFLFR